MRTLYGLHGRWSLTAAVALAPSAGWATASTSPRLGLDPEQTERMYGKDDDTAGEPVGKSVKKATTSGNDVSGAIAAMQRPAHGGYPGGGTST